MTNGQELSIRGTVSLEDFIKYNTHHLKKFTYSYFFFSFFVFWLMALLLEFLMPDNLLFTIPKAVLALIFSLILIYGVKKILKKRVIKEYESDQRIKNEISYVIHREGIIQQLKRSNNHYDWTDLHFAAEYEEMFLLYISKQKAIVLPKRFFESHDDISLFKELISKNIETSKIKIK
ncbi:YcxB family protein [Bacillus alkalicellulosilyticus]|uniref:YcxB family protein n=1 Tax=Alkalihalobacterium alkalicellulosilyticum TaxID=1912214 RepID=UPI0009974D75|nr:YcxB family protein [Bacillus alkalicellulosilyticus]